MRLSYNWLYIASELGFYYIFLKRPHPNWQGDQSSYTALGTRLGFHPGVAAVLYYMLEFVPSFSARYC